MLDAIGDHMQGERRCLHPRLGFRRAIGQHAWQIGNLADLSAVFFALDFDPKHRRYPYPRAVLEVYFDLVSFRGW
jgi:hypothetical protein